MTGLSLRRWVALCATAEAIGMTAAAAAAKAAQRVAGDDASARAVLAGLAFVVAGGLVEGVALGTLQASGLRRMLPALNARRWVLVTVVVAGLGWAAASAPAALSGSGDGSQPPVLLMTAGALGLGAAMGALLGAAQATVLRGEVRHPWRWVGASAAAWPMAMAVIFLGASTPAADWPVLVVAGLGTVTGLFAGAVLGLVSGWFLPTLDGQPLHNLAVLHLLGSPAHAMLGRSLVALRVRGASTGRAFELPVQYAGDEGGLVVLPGHPETKRWWRNLDEPAAVDVLLDGVWQTGAGRLLRPGDPAYRPAVDAYRERWPRVTVPDGDPLVRIGLSAP